MKQLTLELKERLLIVEAQDGKFMSLGNGKEFHSENNVVESYLTANNVRTHKLICRGSELTNEIAEQFIPFNPKKHPKAFLISYTRFINAFKDVIEKHGYYWGENPIEKPTVEKYGWYTANSQEEESGWMYEEGEDKYYEALKEWQEAELKTFNPEKTLIFKIL